MAFRTNIGFFNASTTAFTGTVYTNTFTAMPAVSAATLYDPDSRIVSSSQSGSWWNVTINGGQFSTMNMLSGSALIWPINNPNGMGAVIGAPWLGAVRLTYDTSATPSLTSDLWIQAGIADSTTLRGNQGIGGGLLFTSSSIFVRLSNTLQINNNNTVNGTPAGAWITWTTIPFANKFHAKDMYVLDFQSDGTFGANNTFGVGMVNAQATNAFSPSGSAIFLCLAVGRGSTAAGNVTVGVKAEVLQSPVIGTWVP